MTNRAALQKKIAECEKDAPSLKGKLSEAEKERERASAAYRAAANKYADFLDTLEEQWKTCQSERERLERAGIPLGSSCLNNAACYAEISKFWASCMPVYDRKSDVRQPAGWKTCESERERLERAGIQLGSSCLNYTRCYAEVRKFWARCMPVYDQKFNAADPLPEVEKKRLHSEHG